MLNSNDRQRIGRGQRVMLLCFCAMLAMLTGCDTSTNNHDVTPTEWRSGVGVEWVYSVLVVQTGAVDTLKVSIVDTISSPTGFPLEIWERRYYSSGRTDSIHVGLSLDTALFYVSASDTHARWFYLLDADVGTDWSNDLDGGLMGYDSTTILAPTNVSVPAGSFPNAPTYFRYTYSGVFTNVHEFTTQVVPYVGIVKMTRTSPDYSNLPLDTVLSLISTYSI